MLKSMTGFGKAQLEVENKKINIEIRALNSKFPDINIKVPLFLKSREPEIRNKVSRVLERGKIDLSVNYEILGSTSNFVIDKNVVKGYFLQLQELKDFLGVKNENNFLEIILKLPDSLRNEDTELNEETWKMIEDSIESALNELDNHRKNEGEVLEKDIMGRIQKILDYALMIPPVEEKRKLNIRSRIKQNLEEMIGKADLDQNRFEQELIYYLEKLDITEERVRLDNHCNYFRETIIREPSPGRKLGFICQEIGREINTLGSKANDSDLQMIVINMKDELEKIKEQLLNIL